MKAIVVRRDELVLEEGEQEIRRRVAEQAEKWLVKSRGDLEEKRRERERERRRGDNRKGGVGKQDEGYTSRLRAE